ncbi:MAG: hypothetical protein V4654_11945 [Bdellovibrionota bacterium]
MFSDQITIIKPGDLVSYAVRNPYGNDPSLVVRESGIFQGTGFEGSPDFIRISNKLVHRLKVVGEITVIKPFVN